MSQVTLPLYPLRFEPIYQYRLWGGRRLAIKHGLDVLVPDEEDRRTVHRVIYDELVQGRVEAKPRDAYREIIARLVERGAEAVILGCTEIMLLVRAEDSAVRLFDTTAIHADAAVERALGCLIGSLTADLRQIGPPGCLHKIRKNETVAFHNFTQPDGDGGVEHWSS